MVGIELYYLLATLAVLAALSILSFFSSKSLRYLIAIAMASLICMGFLFFSYTGLTGHPRVIHDTVNITYPFEESEVVVVNFYIKPEENIFLVTRGIKKEQYMLYALDWDEELAQELFEAQNQNSMTGSETVLKIKSLASKSGKGAGFVGDNSSQREGSSQNEAEGEENKEGEKSGSDYGNDEHSAEKTATSPKDKKSRAFELTTVKKFVLKE